MPEIHIESYEQFVELIQGAGAPEVAVVKYTASWCGPCRRMLPDWNRIASAEYDPKCLFLSIDIDQAGADYALNNLMTSSQVQSVPTFHFYKKGAVVDQMSGANVITLESKLKNLTAEAKNAEPEEVEDDDSQAGEIHVKSIEQFMRFTREGVAVVKYTATWCGPCKAMMPDWTRLASQSYDKRCRFLSIDIDEAEEISGLRDLLVSIVSVPTFHFYNGGVIVDDMSGANVSNLENKLQNLTKVQKEQDEAKPEATEEEVEVEKEDDVVTSKDEAQTTEEPDSEEPEKASEEGEEGEKRDFTLKVLDLENEDKE